MRSFDYIVVGSGCTGAMAAQTLAEAGLQVAILDGGLENKNYADAIPDQDYLTLRRTDPNQYKYLIGNNAEGLGWGKVGKAEQITPPRQHIIQLVDKYLPLDSDTFSPYESLAYGGLGTGWGLGCWEYSKAEAEAVGLEYNQLEAAYNLVADRIGISATRDDAVAYTIGSLQNFQPSAELDRNHRLIYKKYLAHKNTLARKGFVMGRAPLALLTQDKNSRSKYSYKDMDFYSDNNHSAWRPWMTVDQLKKLSNFSYIGNQLVLQFQETAQGIIVDCLDLKTESRSQFQCKKLILAPGVLGSARIVLRSLSSGSTKLPLLCNPYSYVPCIQPRLLGQAAEEHKLGFAQLSFFLDEEQNNFGAAMASLYSYQSLMLFRIVRQVPLNFGDARKLLQYLISGLLIMGIHQPDKISPDKYLRLVDDTNSPTGDKLRVAYNLTEEERSAQRRHEKKYFKAMRSLGAFPIKRIDPGAGAAIHYAGCLPFSKQSEPFHVSPTGRLHGTKQVYVADGSGFKYLPAKGLTFSLMANAHLVAKAVLQDV